VYVPKEGPDVPLEGGWQTRQQGAAAEPGQGQEHEEVFPPPAGDPLPSLLPGDPANECERPGEGAERGDHRPGVGVLVRVGHAAVER
jgi:hypothetical protein